MSLQRATNRIVGRVQGHSALPARSISASTRFQLRKDETSKDDLTPWSNEYSKSGSDQEAAQLQETANSKDKLSRDEAYSSSKAESQKQGRDNNPLEVSPANPEVSQTSPDPQAKESGVDKSNSGRGNTSKGGVGKRYQTGREQSTPGADKEL